MKSTLKSMAFVAGALVATVLAAGASVALLSVNSLF